MDADDAECRPLRAWLELTRSVWDLMGFPRAFFFRDFYRPSLFAGFELQKTPIELTSGVRVIWMMGKQNDHQFVFFPLVMGLVTLTHFPTT